MDLQPLALNPTVEELVLYGLVHIGQATRAISELVCLTRLAITTWSRQGVVSLPSMLGTGCWLFGGNAVKDAALGQPAAACITA